MNQTVETLVGYGTFQSGGKNRQKEMEESYWCGLVSACRGWEEAPGGNRFLLVCY